jgi:tetratricopeptide (TPR) repeat protein
VASSAGTDPAMMQELASGYVKVGEVQDRLGDPAGKLASWRKAYELTKQIADAKPDDRSAQVSLAAALVRLGGATSDPKASSEFERQGQEICQRLMQTDSTDPNVIGVLAWACSERGHRLIALGDEDGALVNWQTALGMYQKLLELNPNDSWERRLAATVQEGIANIIGNRGDKAAQLATYRQTQKVFQQLLDADPGNIDFQQCLGWNELTLAELLDDSGDHAAALDHFRAAIAICQKQVAIDPANASAKGSVGYAFAHMGDALKNKGELPEARAAYEQSVAARKTLVDANPDEPTARGDLSYSYQMLAEVMSQQHDESAATDAYRAAAALYEQGAIPPTLQAQMDLGTLWGKIGDRLANAGDTAGAMAYYEKRLANAQRLVAAHPELPRARGQVAHAHGRIGDLIVAQGDLPAALDHYQQSVSARRQAADAAPTDATAQHDLLQAMAKPGPILEKLAADPSRSASERIDLLRQAGGIYQRQQAQSDLMKTRGLLKSEDAKLADVIAASCARCDAAIGQLTPATTQPAMVGPPVAQEHDVIH